MNEFNPKIDEAFREYADLLLRRHYFLLERKEDSDESSLVEARMERIWPQLDAVQQQSLRGMESDLNWIRRKLEPPPRGRKTPADVTATDREELNAAMKSKDWHRVLHYLRLCAPCFRPASIALERGVAYSAIGLPKYANIFKSEAIVFDASKVVPKPIGIDTTEFSEIAKVPSEQAIANEPATRVLIMTPMRHGRAGEFVPCFGAYTPSSEAKKRSA